MVNRGLHCFRSRRICTHPSLISSRHIRLASPDRNVRSSLRGFGGTVHRWLIEVTLVDLPFCHYGHGSWFGFLSSAVQTWCGKCPFTCSNASALRSANALPSAFSRRFKPSERANPAAFAIVAVIRSRSGSCCWMRSDGWIFDPAWPSLQVILNVVKSQLGMRPARQRLPSAATNPCFSTAVAAALRSTW